MGVGMLDGTVDVMLSRGVTARLNCLGLVGADMQACYSLKQLLPGEPGQL